MTTKQTFNLIAEKRELTGKAVQALRSAGKLPAVLYGHEVKNTNLILDLHQFEKILDQAGESTLIDLKIGEAEPIKIIIQAIQRDPVSHRLIHADFYQVNMKEKITTDVELIFVGESPAVKDLSGSLVKALDSIEIECLPGDLISNIEVNISTLKTFDDIIRVRDLNISKTVDILTDLSATVALVEEPVKIEELEPTPAAEVAPVEGEEKTGEEKPIEGEKKPAEAGEDKQKKIVK